MDNLSVFFELERAGLWENIPFYGEGLMLIDSSNVDWEKVYQLAEEQSVVGLVLAGIEHSCVKPPQELLLQWIGEVQIIEQQNKAMNEFVAKLIEKLRNNDVYTLLVKGQGIAQCYERPLWRASGDVDLLLSNSNYYKAKEILLPLASSIEDENKKALHLGMKINDWVVELHGTLHSCCLPKMDKVVEEAEKSVFYGGEVRSWANGYTQVFLPSPDNDLIFIFSHIIKHFFNGGIGLRQICDWCRLLWTYKDSLNHELLESRIRKAGLMSEWKAFAAFAVDYLGMPSEAMPLYSSDGKWSRNAQRLKDYIIEVGNFGHNRNELTTPNASLVQQKISAFKLYTGDGFKQFSIFPLDSIRIWLWIMKTGISTLFNSKENKRKR